MENVMLNSIHTQIKIVDFGLSNVYMESNPLRTHCGSPEYAAPELFTEGKHYGPEVDLWSLGVILYGMVIGQLPFVTIRENNMTSAERRRRLLEQINKGMATPHRRALCLFSPEFKSMMGKLLVADAAKRITVKELIFHPWITEKGRKSVRSNPIKKLDGQYQTIVLRDAGSLLHLSLEEVGFAIKSEPQGSVAGIYNILSFKQTLHQIEGDGITRTLPDSSTNYSTPRPRTHLVKTEAKTLETKTATASKRKETMKSAPVHKVVASTTPRTPMSRQCLPIHKCSHKSSNKVSESIEKSPKKRLIPKILLSKLDRIASSKDAAVSDFMPTPTKRTAQSADEHKRSKLCAKKLLSEDPMNHPISNILNLTRSPEQMPSPLWPQMSPQLLSPTCKDVAVTNNSLKQNVAQENKTTKVAEPKILKAKIINTTTPNNAGGRIQSANVDNPKSDPLPTCRRPLTGPTHTAERALKRRSMLPVTTSMTAPNKTAGNATLLLTQHRNRKIKASKVSDFREKTSQINGDAAKRPSPTKSRTTRHFVNEPIARSIAGYVVNNIPSKLNTFKWAAACKKETS